MDLSTSTSSLSSASSGFWGARGRDRLSSTGTGLLDKILCAVVTCVFTIVGSSVGAVTGGLIGLATESGLFRGAGIGAISGAVFMVEVVESSLALWHSNESGIWSVLYLVDIITSLLSGRLVREKVGPAVQSAVQNQMNAISTPFIEDLDIFETGGTRGMSRDSVNNIQKIKITKENAVDASGEKLCCSVCLQVGEYFYIEIKFNELLKHEFIPLRTFKSKKQLESCLIVNTCFICRASIAGSSGKVLAHYVDEIYRSPFL